MIVQFTGLFGVFLSFFFPPVLLYFSGKKLKTELQEMRDSGEIFGIDLTDEGLKTPYTTFISKLWVMISVILFGFVSLLLMLITIIDPNIFGTAS